MPWKAECLAWRRTVRGEKYALTRWQVPKVAGDTGAAQGPREIGEVGDFRSDRHGPRLGRLQVLDRFAHSFVLKKGNCFFNIFAISREALERDWPVRPVPGGVPFGGYSRRITTAFVGGSLRSAYHGGVGRSLGNAF